MKDANFIYTFTSSLTEKNTQLPQPAPLLSWRILIFEVGKTVKLSLSFLGRCVYFVGTRRHCYHHQKSLSTEQECHLFLSTFVKIQPVISIHLHGISIIAWLYLYAVLTASTATPLCSSQLCWSMKKKIVSFFQFRDFFPLNVMSHCMCNTVV